MSTLRDVKIDLITGNSNPVINLFNEITEGLEMINHPGINHTEREFLYHKEGAWIFYQDYDMYVLWCSYEAYWQRMEGLGLGYGEITEATSFLLERMFKDRGWHNTLASSPRFVYNSDFNPLSQQSKDNR